MALTFLAHFKIFLVTGTVPFAKTISLETISWFQYLLPVFGIAVFGCMAWFFSPFAYILAPFLMKDVHENRKFKRTRLKFHQRNKVQLHASDARQMSVSYYMVAPSWSFIYSRSARWWNSFFNASKVVYRFLYIPIRWSSKWAILWPPPGIILNVITIGFITIVHAAIFLRLFGMCCKQRFRDELKHTTRNINLVSTLSRQFLVCEEVGLELPELSTKYYRSCQYTL